MADEGDLGARYFRQGSMKHSRLMKNKIESREDIYCSKVAKTRLGCAV